MHTVYLLLERFLRLVNLQFIVALRLLKFKFPLKNLRDIFNVSKRNFSLLPETTNHGINNNVTISLVSGIFWYQHGVYFRDELILQNISKIPSNGNPPQKKQVAFVSSPHQYNDIFHYYSYLKKYFMFRQHRIFTTHACGRPSDTLPFSVI